MYDFLYVAFPQYFLDIHLSIYFSQKQNLPSLLLELHVFPQPQTTQKCLLHRHQPYKGSCWMLFGRLMGNSQELFGI